MRASLCALDWNNNVGRPQKLDEFGKPMYREKVFTSHFLSFLILILYVSWIGLAKTGELFQSLSPRTPVGRTELWTCAW